MNHIFFVAPLSTMFWIENFVSQKDVIFIELGENDTYELHKVEQKIKNIAPDKKNSKIYFISSHKSLTRDYYLSNELRTLGYDSSCQSLDMIQLGVDKVKMKSFFEKNSISTPYWIWGKCVDTQRKYLVKDRYGTASEGIFYMINDSIDYKRKYLEEYRKGVEYSVNVFRNHNKELTLYPVVWKGENTEKLIPPYKRLRVVAPYSDELQAIVGKLYKVCETVCNLVDNYGFVEFEFIVSNDEILLLEINPRVSGTLRISSMACEFHAFDNYVEERKGTILKPDKIAIEFPHEGEYIKSDDMEYVCTSRATFAGNNIEEIIKRVNDVFIDENMVDFYELDKLVKMVKTIKFK